MGDGNNSHELTASAIRERLGCSTCAVAGGGSLGAKEMAEIGQAGIRRVEIGGLMAPKGFDFNNRSQIQEIVNECRAQGIRIVSVHGPWVPLESPEEPERCEAMEKRSPRPGWLKRWVLRSWLLI